MSGPPRSAGADLPPWIAIVVTGGALLFVLIMTGPEWVPTVDATVSSWDWSQFGPDVLVAATTGLIIGLFLASFERNRQSARKRDEDRRWEGRLGSMRRILHAPMFVDGALRPDPVKTMRLRQLSEGIEDVHHSVVHEMPVLTIWAEALDILESLVVLSDIVESQVASVIADSSFKRRLAEDYTRDVYASLKSNPLGGSGAWFLPPSNPDTLRAALADDKRFGHMANGYRTDLRYFTLLRTACLDYYRGVTRARTAIIRSYRIRGRRLPLRAFRTHMMERRWKVYNRIIQRLEAEQSVVIPQFAAFSKGDRWMYYP